MIALVRFSWRQVWRGAAIWAGFVAVVVASGTATYRSAYATPQARSLFGDSVAKLPALQALYGRAVGVDTVGGFLTWRYGDVVTVAISLWALLAVTRLLRGDEESGRAELLVASPVPPRRLMACQLGAVAMGLALIGAAIAAMGAALGLGTRGSVLFGAMVVSGGLVFGAIAAVTSQAFDARRRASGWAGAILGASYVVRAVGDGSSRVPWAAWISPLGWAERIEPFTGGRTWPLGLAGATAAALVGLALLLREHRDTGAGLIDERASIRPARPVRSPRALAWRLSRGTLVAWAVGIGVGLFVLGYLTRDVVTFTTDNSSIDSMVRKMFGFSMSDARGYLGLAFTVAAMVLGLYAGTHLMAARDEEAAGRAENLLVARVGRSRWLAGRLALALGATMALAVVAAVAAWIGVLASGEHLALTDALRGTANVVPVALFFGGLAVLCFGIAPRFVSFVAFGSVALAYLVQILGGLSGAPAWVLDLSPFWHLAPVPATSPNTGANVAFALLALGLAGTGTLAFARRDLASD